MPIRISISGNYYIFSIAISGIIWDVKYTNIIYVQLELAKDTTQLQMALGHVYKPERLRLKDLQCTLSQHAKSDVIIKCLDQDQRLSKISL